MLAIGGGHPLLPTAPHFASTADDGACLAYRLPKPHRLELERDLRAAGRCRRVRVPLMREKSVGQDGLKGGLEVDSNVFGQRGTPEVKARLGLHRHLLDGVLGFDAAIHASIARLLGSNHPGFHRRLRVSAEKSLGGGWETGIDAELGALGGFTPDQASERSSLVQWRTRYRFEAADGAEHQLELKLTHETVQGEWVDRHSSRALRADFDYQYRQYGNILSVGVSFIDSHQGASHDNDFRAELRLARPF